MKAIRKLAVITLLLAGLAACTPTPAPTAAPAPTLAPVDVPSPTRPAAPTAPPSPTVAPSPTASPATVQITVYFTDRNRFNAGTPPFETGVARTVAASANLPEAALNEFFKGPTAAEQAQGLEKIASGFTGYSALKVQDGIARLYLSGPCASNGATYTVAQPLMKNLLQFKEIQYVKLYDAAGETTEPNGPTNSIPPCLEP